MAKCEYKSKYWEQYDCKLPALKEPDEDGKKRCIFHSTRANKNGDLFYQEFKKLYDFGDHFFLGFVFPKDFSFKRLRADTKETLKFMKAFFDEAIFLCDVDLSYSKFIGEGNTSFFRAQFFGDNGTDFNNAEFSSVGGTSFRGAKFYTKDRIKIDFSNTKFSGVGETSFVGAIFSGEGITDFSKSKFFCEGGIDFKGAKFSTKFLTTFRESQFLGKGIIDFRNAKFTCNSDISFLRSQFSSEGNTLFSGVEFSNEGKANFNDAVFSNKGRVSFTGAKFRSEKGIYFNKTKFLNEDITDFTNATFSGNGEVNFFRSYFNAKGNIIFENTDFSIKGLVSFKKASFEGKGAVIFEGVNFSKDTIVDFRKVTTLDLRRFTLDNVYVGRWCFFGTYIRHFDFREVFWKKDEYDSGSRMNRNMLFEDFLLINETETILKELNLLGNRKKYEEILNEIKNDLEGKYYELSRLYGQLQINYDETKRYHEAGDFFVGQMELRRIGKFEDCFITEVLCFYKVISLYGERPKKALLWLFILIVLFTEIFMISGLELKNNNNIEIKYSHEFRNSLSEKNKSEYLNKTDFCVSQLKCSEINIIRYYKNGYEFWEYNYNRSWFLSSL